MTRPTDDELMAYADGQLDAQERASIESHLATDAEARKLVEMFKQSGELAAAAFNEPMERPPPKALVDLIMGAGAAPEAPSHSVGDVTAASSATKVVDLANRRSRLSPAPRLGYALAASIALLISFGGGFFAARSVAPYSSGAAIALGDVPASSGLARALDRQLSGSVENGHLIVATFRDRRDRVCREVELVSGGAGTASAAGVACRDARGVWIMEGAARLAEQAPTPGGYVPSGAQEKDALSALLLMLGAKPPLSDAEERRLIDRRWQ